MKTVKWSGVVSMELTKMSWMLVKIAIDVTIVKMAKCKMENTHGLCVGNVLETSGFPVIYTATFPRYESKMQRRTMDYAVT